MPIAEGDDLVAFDLLVAAEADVVTALFGCRRRSIAVNDRNIQAVVLMKLQHRTGKNGVDAAIGYPPPPDAINPRVVNFKTPLAILFDRQFLPLATQIQHPQNVVEDRMQTQLRCRATAADGKMRQDKFFELQNIQLRWNRLPPLISSHSDSPEIWTITYSGALVENSAL